jgi:hypothetical protein
MAQGCLLASLWYRCRCLCKLLDGIQDHYTYAQPGIQRCVFHTQELVRCLATLHLGTGQCWGLTQLLANKPTRLPPGFGGCASCPPMSLPPLGFSRKDSGDSS